MPSSEFLSPPPTPPPRKKRLYRKQQNGSQDLICDEFGHLDLFFSSGKKNPLDWFGRLYTRGRIIRLDELSLVVRLELRSSKDSSSRRIMRLVPVVILETHNQTNYKCWPEFVQTRLHFKKGQYGKETKVLNFDSMVSTVS